MTTGPHFPICTGDFERGPVLSPLLVRSLEEFNEHFGNQLGIFGEAAGHVYQFFKNGGYAIIVIRTPPLLEERMLMTKDESFLTCPILGEAVPEEEE